MGNQLDIKFRSWEGGEDGKAVIMINQEGTFGMDKIKIEVNDESGLNLFKQQVDCYL